MPNGSTLTYLKWQIAENLSTNEIVHPLEIIITKIDNSSIEFIYEADA